MQVGYRAGQQTSGGHLQQDNRAGLIFALAGYTLLSMGDGLLKLGAMVWSPAIFGAARYCLGALLIAVIVWLREGRAGFAVRRPGVQLLRGLGVGVATICFVIALRYMPLADATAIVFVSPILTALIARVALGEPVSRRAWTAILAGFVGVLIIVRPNFAAVGPVAVLPLLAAVGMSGLIIGNRLAATSASPMAMQFQAAAPAALFLLVSAVGLDLAGFDDMQITPPPLTAVLACVGLAVIATGAHLLVYLGTTRAGAAVVAPMTYAQIVVAGLIGWFYFGDPIDPVSGLGIAVIIGAGLFLWNEQRPRALPDEAG